MLASEKVNKYIAPYHNILFIAKIKFSKKLKYYKVQNTLNLLKNKNMRSN